MAKLQISNNLLAKYEKELLQVKNHHMDTFVHMVRTADLATKLGPLFFNEVKTLKIVECMLIHDYGKVFIPKDLLDAKNITKEDKAKIDKHPDLGANSLRFVFPNEKEVLDLVRNHHAPKIETMADDVAFVSFIDVFDALYYPRAYRPKSLSSGEVLEILKKDFASVPLSDQMLIVLAKLCA